MRHRSAPYNLFIKVHLLSCDISCYLKVIHAIAQFPQFLIQELLPLHDLIKFRFRGKTSVLQGLSHLVQTGIEFHGKLIPGDGLLTLGRVLGITG
jgi:hypothetical protein